MALISEPQYSRSGWQGEYSGVHSDRVAGEQQRCCATVPHGDREHAAETNECAFTPLFVCVDDGFGVARGVEAVSAALEFAAESRVVVDLAVENHPDCPVFVVDRLVSG